jgi:thiamine transport system substrate-binding protein
VTPGWSEAYGLFTKGEAQMVLSYTTSPAYHEIAEKTDRYQAADFSEGHPIQIELAAMTKTANADLARQFLKFMISPAFQDIIPENNWMMPVGKTSAPLDPVFDKLVHPKITLTIPAADVARNRKAWIDEWLGAMSMN